MSKPTRYFTGVFGWLSVSTLLNSPWIVCSRYRVLTGNILTAGKLLGLHSLAVSAQQAERSRQIDLFARN
ncbi:hypothetical protein BCEP27_160003 [Burkholderia cepacia]